MTLLVLENLIKTIESRKTASPDSSYTASLLANSPEKAIKKLTEEVTELVIDIMKNDSQAATKEAADVLYHYLVVLAAADIKFSEVLAELANREGISGHAEKQNRSRIS
ncbi:MAG: phosphoribosyl-ATP diphosphatase [Alphaproteobacteria bacterium]|nr:phosphoribosyl-ATP diphosphatase [Alphaproteobacteria bacterium]